MQAPRTPAGQCLVLGTDGNTRPVLQGLAGGTAHEFQTERSSVHLAVAARALLFVSQFHYSGFWFKSLKTRFTLAFNLKAPIEDT